MNRESIAELNAIDTPSQILPEVLQLRLHHLMREKKWARALTVSRKLCQVAPHCSAGFLHAGFCLNELGKTAQAKKLLMKGPATLLREPIYYYNMAATMRFSEMRNRPRSICSPVSKWIHHF